MAPRRSASNISDRLQPPPFPGVMAPLPRTVASPIRHCVLAYEIIEKLARAARIGNGSAYRLHLGVRDRLLMPLPSAELVLAVTLGA